MRFQHMDLLEHHSVMLGLRLGPLHLHTWTVLNDMYLDDMYYSLTNSQKDY